MNAVDRGRSPRLVLAHQDRLARFGFDFLQHLAARGGCEIIVANQESLSPPQELVEDFLASCAPSRVGWMVCAATRRNSQRGGPDRWGPVKVTRIAYSASESG